MKLDAAFARSLLFAVMIGMGGLSQAAPQKQAPQAKEAPPAAAPAEAETQTIPGTVIARKSGGFLSLSVKGGALNLAFYDAEKKQVPADVARAAARWDPKKTIGTERRVLNPSGDGLTLVSTPVKPPYIFKVYLTLLPAEGEATESYVVDLRD